MSFPTTLREDFKTAVQKCDYVTARKLNEAIRKNQTAHKDVRSPSTSDIESYIQKTKAKLRYETERLQEEVDAIERDYSMRFHIMKLGHQAQLEQLQTQFSKKNSFSQGKPVPDSVYLKKSSQVAANLGDFDAADKILGQSELLEEKELQKREKESMQAYAKAESYLLKRQENEKSVHEARFELTVDEKRQELAHIIDVVKKAFISKLKKNSREVTKKELGLFEGYSLISTLCNTK